MLLAITKTSFPERNWLLWAETNERQMSVGMARFISWALAQHWASIIWYLSIGHGHFSSRTVTLKTGHVICYAMYKCQRYYGFSMFLSFETERERASKFSVTGGSCTHPQPLQKINLVHIIILFFTLFILIKNVPILRVQCWNKSCWE